MAASLGIAWRNQRNRHYFDGSEKLRQKESDYAKNVIYMTSFTTGEFTALLAETGFTPLASERDLDGPKEKHEYFFFRK